MDSWLKPAKKDSRLGRSVSYRVFQKWQRLLIEALLVRSTVTVACAEEHADTVLGYLVHEATPVGQVVHWVFVKDSHRELGLARLLLSTLPTHDFFYSHETDAAEPILRKWREDNSIRQSQCQWCHNPLKRHLDKGGFIFVCQCSRRIARELDYKTTPSPFATYNPFLIVPLPSGERNTNAQHE